jgi:hypothetical protein
VESVIALGQLPEFVLGKGYQENLVEKEVPAYLLAACFFVAEPHRKMKEKGLRVKRSVASKG